MNHSKMVVLSCFVLIFALILGGCAQSGAVGVVDMEKVFTESPKVKSYQEQLSQKEEQLTKQLEAEKPNLTAEQYQAKVQAARMELSQTAKSMQAEVEGLVKQTTEQVAKEKKLSTIMYKAGVAYGGTDVTQDVINKMK